MSGASNFMLLALSGAARNYAFFVMAGASDVISWHRIAVLAWLESSGQWKMRRC